MLKKLLLVAGLALTSLQFAFAQRNCGTPSHEHIYQNGTQEIRNKMNAIEQHTENFTQNYNSRTKVSGVITIPVVVHIVYNTAAQNITDAMVQSQIDVLNADYRRTNADRTNTPAAFAGISADFEIQFRLATRDPQGNATTGITRTSTTRTFFEYGGTDAAGVFVKQNSTGGKDGWNPNQYLNMWICNFGGASADLLGYATFPTDAGTFKDGVVMGYKFFGVNPTLGGVYGYGRTTTHEVGHWLNLRHIWGDANCGNDLVTDTPTQQTSNGGCPTFPKRTCGNTTNGDMFMNYMDYTNDQCMNAFTAGQKVRARALFDVGGARASLLTSPGLGTAPTCPTSLSAATGLASSSVTTSSATLSWAAVTGATSYTLQYKTSAATTWTSVSTATTSASVSGLVAGTLYNYQVQVTCGTTNSAFSAVSNFTTSAATVSYCASKGNSVADEWIDLVSLGTINRTSAGDGGYFNGTSLSTSLGRGLSATISYSAGFRSGYSGSEAWAVWIDWNRDGDFLDAGEQVVTRTSTSAATLSSTFTVPTTATLGATRMRVSMKWNAAQTSCEAFSYGEVEDYTINVITGTVRTSAIENAAEGGIKTEIKVYPNPTAEEAKVSIETLNSENLGKVQVIFLNTMGKVMKEVTTDELETSQWETLIDVRELPVGVYFVTINNNGTKQTKRLVVAR
ncbi:MAG: T9SS C-terminal target domain-containing protein [Bacteroidetes bacterium]|nr:MAG: T9SS C-terminal target domain-containing protein [Bacteroidota bacterium]TAG89738.1 MAG: T9SS C-terminal target domain-containing protein [Bacteroidota bacterium]